MRKYQDSILFHKYMSYSVLIYSLLSQHDYLSAYLYILFVWVKTVKTLSSHFLLYTIYQYYMQRARYKLLPSIIRLCCLYLSVNYYTFIDMTCILFPFSVTDSHNCIFVYLVHNRDEIIYMFLWEAFQNLDIMTSG